MKFFEKKTFLKLIKKYKYDVLTLKEVNIALKQAEINPKWGEEDEGSVQ